jgi:putative ABC transport system permease protein
MTESVVLALIGAAAGTLLAIGGVAMLRLLGTSLDRRDLGVASVLPMLDQVRVDGMVLTFTLVAAVIMGVVLGLAPAVRSAGSSLASNVRATSRQRAQSLLVATQIAVATILLVGAPAC